jgi:predicted DNA-binding protein (UPF0251 family)
MPRPKKPRRCRAFRGHRVFKPIGVPMSGLRSVQLDLAELEAMRLCDFEGMEQEEAGRCMHVSRGTVQRLVKSGRAKVIESLVRSTALVIE